ncbi:MAG TPA: hypothetical protein RMH99_07620 [Sandaracinaceae bacterium LLY-WYZ-13_1]|nr:hypothetical protein [Sandaracinaceae bacterium LLY-WYZ-13_1]
MVSPPAVGSVLLVASEMRRDELEPALRVVGAPVTYEVEVLDPARAAGTLRSSEGTWDVVIVDGVSTASDEEREALLRAARLNHYAAILYVASRLPTEEETQQAFAWADDTVAAGWCFEERLRRRVQSIALAPWRRVETVRAARAQLGGRRLRLVRAEPEDAGLPAVVGPQAETVEAGEGALDLVVAALREARGVGVASMRRRVGWVCAGVLEELEETLSSWMGAPDTARVVQVVRARLLPLSSESAPRIEDRTALADR